jgi:hypothetical protein
LHDHLASTLAKLRAEQPKPSAERRGRALAIRGFSWTLAGIQVRIDMAAKDSGRLEAAVRDAKRSDRALDRGARLLRAAGEALGIRVGAVDGH